MAQFNIHNQHADLIQQADVIHVAGPVSLQELDTRLQGVQSEVDRLIRAGTLDVDLGVGLQSAISEAVATADKPRKLHALLRASNIATGVAVLAGITATISEIASLLS